MQVEKSSEPEPQLAPLACEGASSSPAVFDRRDAWAAGGIFLLALLVRLVHLHQISLHDPYFTLPSVDGAVYDAWAREILAGDWVGEGVLFMGPLYPYFMAGVYAVFGPSLVALKAVQAVMGSAACVCVWGVAREIFDRRVALLAGGMAALYTMSIFYGGSVMVLNLQVLLVSSLVWMLIRTLARPSYFGWVVCGLLLGLSALARQTTLLIAPLVALWILFDPAADVARWRRLAMATVFGVAIVSLIAPFTIRNYVVGDDFVLLNSLGGANFYMGNAEGADGTWSPPSLGSRHRVDNPKAMDREFRRAAEEAEGRPLKASEVSAYWMARGLDEVRADPIRWLRLEARKFGLFFNAYEVWNNRSIEISRDFSWVLRLPLVGFGLVVPLGLLGVALSLGRWRRCLPAYAVFAAYGASALLFFVLSRYRMPAVLVLLPFAAYCPFALFDVARERAWRKLGLSLVALVGLVWCVHLPLTSPQRLHMAYYNLGNKFRELERFDEAVLAYQQSLRANPRAISTYNNLAVALELGGQREMAIRAWKAVGALAVQRRDAVRLERARRHLTDLGVEWPVPPDSEDASGQSDPSPAK